MGYEAGRGLRSEGRRCFKMSFLSSYYPRNLYSKAMHDAMCVSCRLSSLVERKVGTIRGEGQHKHQGRPLQFLV